MPKKTKSKRRAVKATAKPAPKPQTKKQPLLKRWQSALGSSQSFRLTKRRDLPKRLVLPKLPTFTGRVLAQIFSDWRLFGLLLILHVIVLTLTAGVISQADYRNLTDSLNQSGDQTASAGDGLINSLILFGASLGGTLGSSLSGAQEFALIAVNFITWLIIIWLVRQRLTDAGVRLRDGLYNGPAPLISSLVAWFFVLLELVPAALGALIFSVAVATGVANGGIEAGLFGLAALLLLLVSLYFLAGGLLATVAVTLPGIYPWDAIKSAHRMVSGNRLPVIGRLAWLGLLLVLLWAVVLIPFILLDQWLKITWLPLVPVVAQVLNSISLIIGTVFVYMLYRSLLDVSAD
ncbi:MAG TPA: hypothetical protein VFL81_02555 [Candidatus Saccharimonadales bacterium]|nr:hypothetical protein [Candidatus Saccharimonadales bacterium]